MAVIKKKKPIKKKNTKKIAEESSIQSFKKENINNFIQKNKITLIIATLVIVFCGYQFYKSDTYFNFFGLSHNDTVYDFFQSSNDERVYFLQNSCNDGKCLTYSHWNCGYNIIGSSKYDMASTWDGDSGYAWCLSNEIKNSKSHKKLGDIILNCGIANSYLEGFSQRLISDTKEYNKRLKQCSDKGL